MPLPVVVVVVVVAVTTVAGTSFLVDQSAAVAAAPVAAPAAATMARVTLDMVVRLQPGFWRAGTPFASAGEEVVVLRAGSCHSRSVAERRVDGPVVFQTRRLRRDSFGVSAALAVFGLARVATFVGCGSTPSSRHRQRAIAADHRRRSEHVHVPGVVVYCLN